MVKAALTLITAEDRPDVIASPEYEATVMALHALAERFPEVKQCETGETGETFKRLQNGAQK